MARKGGEFVLPATCLGMTVRLATAAVFIVATAVAIATPAPVGLPAIALGQAPVYRLEILLALVYGGLLLLMPFVHGVLRGNLPIEISHKGARWPMQAEETVAGLEEEVAQLKEERDNMLKSKHYEEGDRDGAQR